MRKKNKDTLDCALCKHITSFIQKLNKRKKTHAYYIDEKEYRAIVKKHLSGE